MGPQCVADSLSNIMSQTTKAKKKLTRMMSAYWPSIEVFPRTTNPLNHGLLEKRRRDHFSIASEAIRVNQSTANDTGENDAEPATKHLREVSDDRTTSHCSQIRHHLRYRDGIGRETVLVLQHRRIQILAAMGPVESQSICKHQRS